MGRVTVVGRKQLFLTANLSFFKQKRYNSRTNTGSSMDERGVWRKPFQAEGL
jgi:hypothetical protein